MKLFHVDGWIEDDCKCSAGLPDLTLIGFFERLLKTTIYRNYPSSLDDLRIGNIDYIKALICKERITFSAMNNIIAKISTDH